MTEQKRHSAGGFGGALLRLGIGLVFLAPACLRADVKKLQIDKNSPEGQYMDLVALESDSAKKVALLEHFLTLFPKTEPGVTAWIYIELQDRYRRTGALDKALAAGERVLAIDPDNIEVSRANWRIAETKKDDELVKKWTAVTGKIAERLVKAPLPSDPDAMKAAEEVMAYARQFVVNSDYDDFNKAVKTADPAQRLAALDDFIRKSPQNPYMDQIEIAQFLAYKEIGDVDKTVAAAERILARDANRDDAMLFIAELNFRRKKDPKRTLELANKFIERMAVATKPEAQSEADWTRSKNRNLMLAHYMIGTLHFQAGQWAAADKSLRAALAFGGDDQLKSTLLYNLGWANYQMQSAVEAIKFYRLCAAIPGPMRDQAGKNVLSIKSEYNLP